ncbi:MAG: hypothetical protein HFJ24_00835 [Clostridia bacterium]|nr:hypothetical protein [Clostridia bacterium]MCI9274622.1 hypothetical protein [Clostridia bacterium]
MGVFYSHEPTYEEYLSEKFREFVEKDPDITQEKGRELSEAELIAKRIPPFKGWDTDS